MTRLNLKASTFVFLLPFALLRFALMVGNWGQHALVDEVDPNSDFRTSITMIDVMVCIISAEDRMPLNKTANSHHRATASASTMDTTPRITSTHGGTGGNTQSTSYDQKKHTVPAGR